MSFIVNRPKDEAGFRLDRTQGPAAAALRVRAYAADQPEGKRYG